MEKKHQVHNLIILDESSSMNSIKTIIIQGFNELVQTIKGIEKKFPEQEHYISFVSFSSLEQKLHHFIDKASLLNKIDSESYNPNGMTPLFDAMGFSINKLKQSLQGQTDYSVLVTILTDGEENSSMEYSGNDIKKLVEELKQNSWTFTYIGTDHDVEKVAYSLSIDNTMAFQKNEKGIKAMFEEEACARVAYSQNLHSNKGVSDYFKKKTENDKKDKSFFSSLFGKNS